MQSALQLQVLSSAVKVDFSLNLLYYHYAASGGLLAGNNPLQSIAFLSDVCGVLALKNVSCIISAMGGLIVGVEVGGVPYFLLLTSYGTSAKMPFSCH